jgi:hypothetical protein
LEFYADWCEAFSSTAPEVVMCSVYNHWVFD